MSDGQAVTGTVLGDVVQVRNVGGNVTITLSRPSYRVEGFRASRGRLSTEAARAQPSRLLLARNEVVPFQGREALLEDLASWLAGPDGPMSVRLVHGPGGQGKSRLATHLARAHASEWQVWQARQPLPTAASPSRLENPAGGRGLVVVDYADRWALSHLQALLADMQTLTGRLPGTPSLRVLLLARSAAWWWDAVEDWLDSDLQVPATAIALPALGEQADRRGLFTAARDHFAAAMGVAGSESIDPPERLDDPSFAQVLTVHMAALVAVDAHLHDASAPTRPERNSEYLLKRERGHWLRWHTRPEDPLPTPPQTMGRAAFIATLTGPLSYAQGVEALQRAQIERPDQTLTDHRRLYPPDDPETVLEPLYPDRLGEDLLALTIPGGGSADVADPWAQDATFRLVTPSWAWTGTAITVLAETARRWPHVATRLLSPLLRAHPQLAMHADSSLLTTIAALPDLDPAVLQGITDHLPGHRNVDLDIGIAALVQRLADHSEATSTDLTERARVHTMLTNRLSNAGLHDKALAAAETAADLFQQLAVADPAAFEPELAVALHNLGLDLSRAGRHEEALATTNQAVAVYRRLASAAPAGYEFGLAGSLNNLGSRLSNLGRREESLAAHQEAASIHRRIGTPDSDLAVALNNLGLGLWQAGRREDALATIQEAVDLFRRLAVTDPAAFEPDLAQSLNALNVCLGELGQLDESLAVSREAVDIHRRLAAINPAAFEPDLALSLENLGRDLSGAGQGQQALSAAREALDIHRRLATARPAAFGPDLAASLNSYGARLSELGRADDALDAAREAVAVFRRLASANPGAFEPDLAETLHNLGEALHDTGHHPEAITALKEAVRLFRRLAADNPDVFGPDLETALLTATAMMRDQGREQDAQRLDALIQSGDLARGAVSFCH